MKNILSIILIFLIANTYSQNAELITQEKNLGIITCIDYSSDGRYIASGSDKDFTIKIWDVQSGKMLGILNGHTALINDISFHPSGEELISVGADKKNYVWSLINWGIKDSIGSEDELIEAEYNADGAVFYAANDKKEVQYWNTSNYKLSQSLGEFTGSITSLKVTTKYILASSSGSEVGIWNQSSKELLKKFKPNGSSVIVGLTEVNEYLVSGDDKGKIIVTGLSNYKEKKSFEAHKSLINLCGNSNKKIIATAGNDKTVKIWNLEGKLLTTFENKSFDDQGKEIEEKVQDLVFSPEGSILATTGYKTNLFNKVSSKDNTIKLYDVERKRLFDVLKGDVVAPEAFCFNPVENYFYTVNDSIIKVWDLNIGENIGEVQLHERKKETVFNSEEKKEQVNNSANNGVRDIKNAALNGNIPRFKIDKEKLKIKTKQLGAKTTKGLIKKRQEIYISEKGNYLITKFVGDEYRLYALNNGIPEYKSFLEPKISGGVNGFAVSPDENNVVFIGGGEKPINIVDIQSGNVVRSLKVGSIDNKLNEVRALTFSNDGSFMAVVSNSGLVTFFSTSTWSKLGEADLKGGVRKNAFIAYGANSNKLFIQTLIGVFAIDTKTFIPENVNSEIVGRPVVLNHPSDYIVSMNKEGVYFYNTSTKAKSSMIPFDTKSIVSIEINKYGYIGISFVNGEIKIIDPMNGKERFLMVCEGDNAIFKTPENYYKITKEGTELVTFRVGKNAYPFEQFDAKFNRPDIVLKAMNSEDVGLINLYVRAYNKRLSKLGISDGDLSEDMVLPELQVSNRNEIPLVTSKRDLILKVIAEDKKYELTRINVWINDVPFFGSGGIRIDGNEYNDDITISLAAGDNKIQVSTINAKGIESLKETIMITCDVNVTRNLYVVSIGTSKYKDDRFTLNYAAKDAKDIAGLLANKENKVYATIYEKIYTDEEVKRDNFSSVKEFLSKASIDDQVLVFIAGHGVLDSDLDYYYGTYDIDFNNPKTNGLRYDEIENVLDGIRAIRKLLIMDTCHSGEVEKDEVAEAESKDLVEGDVMFRSVGVGLVETNKEGVSPSKMAKELFSDLRRGTGTTVISSAGGAEFAMESSDWKNGLFTYCLLSGLRNRTADLNKDGKIMLTELQLYVTDKVSKLSHGKQIPTSRIQNIALDYQIW